MYAEKVKALVRARAEALIEGCELYDRLNERSAKAVAEDARLLERVRRKIVRSE
jgi:hypothetical protein